MRRQVRRHRDRAHARSAAAVRDAEGLVQVQVADVGAEVAGPRHPDHGVHVGAVEVDLAAVPVIGYTSVSIIYLLVITGLAFVFGRSVVLVAPVLSALLWNFLFIPPRLTFSIYKLEDILMFVMLSARSKPKIKTRLNWLRWPAKDLCKDRSKFAITSAPPRPAI